KRRKNDVNINNFNNTFCINIRCLLCNLLTYSASGNVPVSFLWQLFSNNIRPELPKENFEWTIYVQIIEYTKYSGWNLKKLNDAFERSRVLNKIIIKATESLRYNKKTKNKIVTNIL
ncbi:unnamed protein product, partial [Didymodactylos carnosus]